MYELSKVHVTGEVLLVNFKSSNHTGKTVFKSVTSQQNTESETKSPSLNATHHKTDSV